MTRTKTGKRKKKMKPTSDVMKRLNDKHSEERAMELIHTNFSDRDYCAHLTYADGKEPETNEEAQRNLKNFIRRLTYLYKKNGAELKYFAVGAEGEDKGRKHFHVILNGEVSRETIESAWKAGYCNVDRLYFDETGVASLVGYVMKQIKIGARRWRASRNLKNAEVKKSRDHVYTRRDAVDVAMTPYANHLLRLYPGYTLSKEVEYQENLVNGGIYLRIMLYKDNAKFIQKKYGGQQYVTQSKYSIKDAQLKLGLFSRA